MAPNAISSVEWSIGQGVNHYYNALQLSKTLSLGDDRKMISQAYNFGTAYISWLGSTAVQAVPTQSTWPIAIH